ncbi:hypothetical protein EI546_04085 [Aequorivita sp. H23M31]|uniref:DUF4870 domain-containing protein n=1 Tax=Aequorivita ciconiae TaxID=2494375 RepID=A0A410G109_9FLAO|nr:hypothetical protein [Aequorivita sp. H23M31]QAA80956.1 hypothetical protein EI546_04085 [Aequorivita sp. H23M31]
MSNTIPGKSTALIAYAPFVGFFIAFFINQDKKDSFATWHIKNMFGIFLFFIASLVIQSSIDFTIGDIVWAICFILWIYCWIQAFLGKERGIPFLSEKFQEWFTFLN